MGRGNKEKGGSGSPVSTLIQKSKAKPGASGTRGNAAPSSAAIPPVVVHAASKPINIAVPAFDAFKQLDTRMDTVTAEFAKVHETRRNPLSTRKDDLALAVAGIRGRTNVPNTEQGAATLETDCAAQHALAGTLLDDIDRAVQRGPKLVPAISFNLPTEVTTQTGLTLASLAAAANPAATLSLVQAGAAVDLVRFPVAGPASFVIAAATGEDTLPTRQDVSVTVILPTRQVTWTPPGPMVFGTPVTVASLGASATGEGGPLLLDPPDGILQVGASPNLHITAPGTPGVWLDGVKNETVAVTPAPRTLVAKLPGKRRYKLNETLDAALFNAKPAVGEGTAAIIAPAGGVLAAAGAVVIVLDVPASGNYAAASRTLKINVDKGTPTLAWVPKAMIRNTKLGAEQLNAEIDPVVLKTELVYTPAFDTLMTTAAPQFLSVRFPGNANWDVATREARLEVLASAEAVAGNVATQNGTSMRTPTAGSGAEAALLNWTNDKDEVKTQAGRIMEDLSGKTGLEMQTYLDQLQGAKRHGIKNAIEPIWTLPNGLQARLKFEGDKFNPKVMFSLEVRLTNGPSADQREVAFKITADGKAAAKGPGDVIPPASLWDEAKREQFKKGACSATHLQCRPKEPQVLTWAVVDGQVVKTKTTMWDLFKDATCLGGAELSFFLDRQKKTRKELEGLQFQMTGDVKLSVETTKTDHFTGNTVVHTIKVER